MLYLNLAIYNGDAELFPFKTKEDLCDYLKELTQFNCIWVVTENTYNGEVFITENIDMVINLIKTSILEFKILHVQEYQTYEDAYDVALMLKEQNPKCYS